MFDFSLLALASIRFSRGFNYQQFLPQDVCMQLHAHGALKCGYSNLWRVGCLYRKTLHCFQLQHTQQLGALEKY